MKNFNFKKIKGYIEGYYGKILSWNDRKRIIDKLVQNKMNYFFYCPKEDIHHRLNWRSLYDNEFLCNFRDLNDYAIENKIKIIVGISPGLDFDYKSFIKGSYRDLIYLERKIDQFLKIGINNIAILFDDIPSNLNLKLINEKEGTIHANVINKISSRVNIQFFAVPRVYSDELNTDDPEYLNDFFCSLKQNIYTFFTGKHIVSKKFETKLSIIKKSVLNNKIVYWDNYYANDYCPKKFFIGPCENKHLIDKSMINGTGLIETDLLILEIVAKTQGKVNKKSIWKRILISNGVPKQFLQISKSFLSPNFSDEHDVKRIKISQDTYECLDYLLWKWKNALSREWYPFLLNFKHDLQILDKKLSLNRIIKTQTNPLQQFLINREDLNE